MMGIPGIWIRERPHQHGWKTSNAGCAEEFLINAGSSWVISVIISAQATPHTHSEWNMLLSPSQCSMIFTLVMTHAGSHSVAVGNKRTTDAPQWKCDLKKSMNDWAIHLSAASWRWQAGSSDKGAALTGERFTAFVLPQMRVMITRVGSSARLTVSMVLEWGIPLCVCVCVGLCGW